MLLRQATCTRRPRRSRRASAASLSRRSAAHVYGGNAAVYGGSAVVYACSAAVYGGSCGVNGCGGNASIFGRGADSEGLSVGGAPGSGDRDRQSGQSTTAAVLYCRCRVVLNSVWRMPRHEDALRSIALHEVGPTAPYALSATVIAYRAYAVWSASTAAYALSGTGIAYRAYVIW
eukprot:3940876-Rhodomonas_salina.4